MKRLLLIFAPCVLLSVVVFAKQITLDIPDDQIKVIETYVPDGEKWIRKMIKDAIGDKYETLIREERQECLLNSTPVPTTPELCIKQAMQRLGTWKSRNP